jgi:hypothetical protein
MPKQIGLILIATVCLSLMSISSAVAQDTDKDALTLGEFIKGTITDKVHEVSYSFSGKKGDIVTLEMLPDPVQEYLDPQVELRNSDGLTLAINDEFNYPLALAIAELPYDGDYFAIAGRSGGDSGDSGGDYSLRVSVVNLVGPGSVINTQVNSDADAPAQIYVMHPKKSGPLDINFSQTPGDYFAGFQVLQYAENGAPDILARLDNTSKLTKASLTLNLIANNFYVIKLEQASYSFDDPVDFPVTLELK